jgi:hypothetical protein
VTKRIQTDISDELYERLAETAKPRSETVAATMKRIVADYYFGNTSVIPENYSSTKKVMKVKFTPPTAREAEDEVRERSFHFSAEEFVNYYSARGWRMKSGPMKDWRAAMVTWETLWRKRQEENQNGRKLNYAEQRFEDNVAALNRLYPVDRGAGNQAGGGVERADARCEAGGVRGVPEQGTPRLLPGADVRKRIS